MKDCKGDHSWGRLASYETIAFGSRRKVTSCNDCMAIKIRFHIAIGMVNETEREVIVEPISD